LISTGCRYPALLRGGWGDVVAVPMAEHMARRIEVHLAIRH